MLLRTTDPFRDLDRLTQQLMGTTNRPAVMPMDAWREGDLLVLASSERSVPPPIVGELAVRVPGVTQLPAWTVRAEFVGDVALVRCTEWERCIRVESSEGVTVGERRPGDRIELSGLNGRRRLQDVFVGI